MPTMRVPISPGLVLAFLALQVFIGFARAQPATLIMPLEELTAGMEGEVMTVFSGTKPEPFKVKVVGVVRNAIGPGKSIIICELTDPRVQAMGATAGMSGSPLTIQGKLAGALSYQVQRFETVRHAGFTPAADLLEVRDKIATADGGERNRQSGQSPRIQGELCALSPVFALSGVSPKALALLEPLFQEQGLQITALAGGTQASGGTAPAVKLVPGGVVAAALALGDIAISGTGSVSMVDGARITAFGHPMLGLGEVDIPLCSAEIVTILPSSLNSIKISNLGAMIGTIQQDRLTGVSGTLGVFPELIDVSISLKRPGQASPQKLSFKAIRQVQLSPLIVATGLLQAVLNSNEAGYAEGFRVRHDVFFPGRKSLPGEAVYPGSSAFILGLRDLLLRLSMAMNNPYERVFPERVSVEVEALGSNPLAVIESFQVSRSVAQPGETVVASIQWRDFQGKVSRERLSIIADPSWTGKNLELALVGGQVLDELTEPLRLRSASRYRSFDAYLEAQRKTRRSDGLYLVVLEKSSIFSDQATTTIELPSSLERIARQSDETRFQRLDAYVPLFENHLLPGRSVSAQLRRPLRVSE